MKAAVQSLLTEQQWKFFKKEYAMRLLWLSEQQKSKTENKSIIKPDQVEKEENPFHVDSEA